jgi:hypothetical protein
MLAAGTGLPDTALGAATPVAGWCFHLAQDPQMTAGTFCVRDRGPEGDATHCVELTGSDAPAMLHAVYTLLARVGVFFDVTGVSLPDPLRLARLDGWSATITPSVTARGIRQHLNFPMDISAYPLWEATEYMRNLARLRFNRIVFHSYPGMFYETPGGALAGSFFYGQPHPLPMEPTLRRGVRNAEVFCIPEVEPLATDLPRRSAAARRWLSTVMAQAQQCGLTVQFSCEPAADTPEATAAIARAILTQYPR